MRCSAMPDEPVWPVESNGDFFIISEAWVDAGIPFPGRKEIPSLLKRGFKVKEGVVHQEGVARRAHIYFHPTSSDEQSYAILAEDDVSDFRHAAPGEVKSDLIERYLSALRTAYEFTEGVLPEQRLHVESEFVEPT